jgi:hypothetical protein
MIPYTWPVARAVPPTLEKRREIRQGIQALAARDAQDALRRCEEIAAIRRDLEAVGRNCALIEQTFRKACLEAAALIAQSQARKRATAILKASADDPVHPGWPAGTPGGRGGKFRPKDSDGGGLSSATTGAAGGYDGTGWTADDGSVAGAPPTSSVRVAAGPFYPPAPPGFDYYPPVPPGYDPNTWKQGQWRNGMPWLEDPERNKYMAHKRGQNALAALG